ncbi:hypothetical protein FHS27_004077 [Rhodopirellula rubra]|uniref:DUF2971 domain-containing protein n=1 Tax=Aporhodopirellula rubra TaxID=980271 RepID=A0A7W5E162_9BACT|nr:DUF2971 domain-containing protein [Aporhodopirellula rubra]MBB3208250.1 hypothetical protein [Aporhodopirellula rubra]
MLFYKFQKAGNLEFGMLRRGEIFFASPSELNDANECRPRWILHGNLEHWQRLASWILDKTILGNERLSGGKPELVGEILETAEEIGSGLKRKAKNRNVGLEELEQMFIETSRDPLCSVMEESTFEFFANAVANFVRNELPKFLSESRYLSSFSLEATNPTMWGHYAAAEKGFVLVYSTKDGRVPLKSCVKNLHGFKKRTDDLFSGHVYEIGIYDELAIPLKAVQYRAKPPTANALRELVPQFRFSEREEHYDGPELLMSEASEKEGSLVGLVKSTDWRYENEVRAFFPSFFSLAPDDRVLSVDINNFIGVICGARMSPREKGRVCICCHHWMQSSAHDGDVCLFQAEQVRDKFDFTIKPIGTVNPKSPSFDGRLPLIRLGDLKPSQSRRIRSLAKEIAEKSKKFVPYEDEL